LGVGRRRATRRQRGGGKKGGGTVGFLDTLALVGSSRRMQLILPAVIFNGASLGFCLGAFTTVFAQSSDGTYAGLLKANYVGFYGATFYLTNSFFSYMWGKVLPLLGRRRVFYVSGVAMALWIVLVTYVCSGGLAPGVGSQYQGFTEAWSSGLTYAVIFGSAAIFSLGDSVLESQLPAIVQSPTFFPLERERDAAISNVKMWQSLGYCLQFGLGSGLSGLGITASAQIQTYVLVVLCVLCYGGLYTCDWYVASFDAAKDGQEED
jgi:MFS family permease